MYWKKSWRILLRILYDFCCASGIYTVEHPEDVYSSGRNMWVLSMKGVCNKFIKCEFFGLCMNDNCNLKHGMEHTNTQNHKKKCHYL